MSDSINTGDIKDSQGVAIGPGATAIVNNYNLPHARPDAVSNLPLFNRNFTGRAEILNDIATNFEGDSGSVVVTQTQAISGLGGVGKTQVALAYAHTHRDQYDIIWVLGADETTTLDSGLRLLGETLELPVMDKDAVTARTMVLSHLSTNPKDILLIFDNADKIEPRTLRPYLPPDCHLLITSHRQETQWRGMAHPLRLDKFSAAEAHAFWQRRLGDVADATDALAELAQELGYLPLALEQAAAYMLQRTMVTATGYLRRFKERRQALWQRETAPDQYHATIATTWQMAFDHAQETTGGRPVKLVCLFCPRQHPVGGDTRTARPTARRPCRSDGR